MSKLNFKNEGLRRLIEISDNATEHKCSYGQAIQQYEDGTDSKYDFGTEIPEKYYRAEKATLWLVKDEGIYLMSSAKLEPIPVDGSHVAYAVGYDPRVSNVYNKCLEAVGGDDFVECFELTAEIRKAVAAGCSLTIIFTPNYFELILVKKI